MTLFFPDLNVWLALSVAGHSHNREAWNWWNALSGDAHLLFSRYTQIGLLRLLTNTSVMGEQVYTLKEAWTLYDRWLEDPRVEFSPDPRQIESGFRQATGAFASKSASKWVGDCWLLAYAQASHSRLVTFDHALCDFACQQGNNAVRPG